jgi:hypothetical protein
MTNIIELGANAKHQKTAVSEAERAAVVADLVALSAGIREAVEKTVELSGPSLLQLERGVQHLVDALHQLENAMNALTDGGEWAPFPSIWVHYTYMCVPHRRSASEIPPTTCLNIPDAITSRVEVVHSKVVLSSRPNPTKKESAPAMPGGGGGMSGMGGMDF